MAGDALRFGMKPGQSHELPAMVPYRTAAKKMERGRPARFVTFIAGGTPALLFVIASEAKKPTAYSGSFR
jgi:hypothetical protein